MKSIHKYLAITLLATTTLWLPTAKAQDTAAKRAEALLKVYQAREQRDFEGPHKHCNYFDVKQRFVEEQQRARAEEMHKLQEQLRAEEEEQQQSSAAAASSEEKEDLTDDDQRRVHSEEKAGDPSDTPEDQDSDESEDSGEEESDYSEYSDGDWKDNPDPITI